MSAFLNKICDASLKQISLSWQSLAQCLQTNNLNMRRKLNVANALIKRIPILTVIVGEMKRRREQTVQLLPRGHLPDINLQNLWNLL